MKKILWLCNIVLPDFCQEFAIRRNNYGGWMTGMLHGLEKIEDWNVSLCFPIIDNKRLKNGECNGHHYYTFLCDMNAITYTSEMVRAFEEILEESEPDIIHIWGTEYPHTTAMLLACRDKGLLNKVVINIQGLVSVYAKHYLAGIPMEYRRKKNENGVSIEDAYFLFEERGKYEIESIKMVQHVIGRTDWDRACIEAINPQAQYHFCNEILRDDFYKHAGTWQYNNCQKYSIFVSQASYPIKGFHYLLLALPIIIKKYPNTQVYVAGKDILNTKKDTYAFYIENLMREFDLLERVCFLGSLNENQMIEQYLKANVFVLPSLIENSPNSLNEAKILGVPTIASFVGGSYSGQNVGFEGYLYPYDEPVLLAYYIGKVFENENGVCKYFSENGVKNKLVQNDIYSCVDANIKIYEKIIKM